MKIEEFIGSQKYKQHSKLISVLFKKKQKYYTNGEIDHLKVLKKLKTNGLLIQNFDTPTEFMLEIISFENHKLFIKSILDSLSQMGFSYVIIKEVTKIDNKIKLTLSIQTQYIVDPISFNEEITKRGGAITKIHRYLSNKWRYTIDSSNLKLNDATEINAATTKLKKSLKDYYLKIDTSVISQISIRSYNSNRWHPFISYYDKNLALLSSVKVSKVTHSYDLILDENCKYIRVGDLFTLNNIKKGLIINAVFKEEKNISEEEN